MNKKLQLSAVRPLIIGVIFWFGAIPLPAIAGNDATDSPDIISDIKGDLNGDGTTDRAALITSIDTDQVNLVIDFADATGTLHPVMLKKAIAWSGAMAGTKPSLEQRKNGSLVVTSGNQAIGRNRWQQQLTIAYRNEQFVVAGYTYDAYDTLDQAYHFSCDINLLTGAGIKNQKHFKRAAKTTSLAEWSDNSIPEECRDTAR